MLCFWNHMELEDLRIRSMKKFLLALYIFGSQRSPFQHNYLQTFVVMTFLKNKTATKEIDHLTKKNMALTEVTICKNCLECCWFIAVPKCPQFFFTTHLFHWSSSRQIWSTAPHAQHIRLNAFGERNEYWVIKQISEETATLRTQLAPFDAS